MEKDFINSLYNAHQEKPAIPSPSRVCNVINGLLKILFPELSDRQYNNARELQHHYYSLKLEIHNILAPLEDQLAAPIQEIENGFFESLPTIKDTLLLDAEAISSGDPAAVGYSEVIRSYPGFFAIAVYRLAHLFHRLSVPLIPRMLTEYAHRETGIDIHPGATIGKRFCIDHGTGIVFGETVLIGDNVKIYQGVTLGALSVKKEMAQTKRHPTIEDNVIIYAGATILGGNTTIGHDTIIGGNVWITKSIAPNSRIYYRGPAQEEKVL